MSAVVDNNAKSEFHKEAGRGQLVDATQLSMHLGNKFFRSHMCFWNIHPNVHVFLEYTAKYVLMTGG